MMITLLLSFQPSIIYHLDDHKIKKINKKHIQIFYFFLCFQLQSNFQSYHQKCNNIKIQQQFQDN
ncbi:unnamed protein product [Paramecium pentaurelia]|uniref:Uncharacterized protein n=1 Tax=Paramecium pentaurelia TaxID=43138 RepID=A0A8S1UTP7_9CILI|nr:unnamed protein product [Paramecium pentaurelia]